MSATDLDSPPPFASPRRRAAGLVWLLFVGIPVADLLGGRHDPGEKALAVTGAVLFVTIYAALLIAPRRPAARKRVVASSALVLLATALTIAEGEEWGMLFIFAAGACAFWVPRRLAVFAVVTDVLLAAGALLLEASLSAALSYAAPAAGVGTMMLLVADLRARNEELFDARSELARLAVAEERARFARDLHDLLGHSLSVIALKAELAGRLLPVRPEDAAREIGELEEVARGALSEVRDAVSGYRSPTLDDELEGARVALAAAGIEAAVNRSRVPIAPDVEAVLAWTVREGATNVIRHSRARRCSLSVIAARGEAGVEVLDDGIGPAASAGSGGHGLDGLRERVARVDGRLETGAAPDGGFRLRVSVPVGAGAG